MFKFIGIKQHVMVRKDGGWLNWIVDEMGDFVLAEKENKDFVLNRLLKRYVLICVIFRKENRIGIDRIIFIVCRK